MIMIKDLCRALRRKPLRAVEHLIVAFSVLWTFTEALDFFVPGVVLGGRTLLGLIAAASVLYTLWKVWKPSRVSLKVSNTNTVLEVLFGDLFQQEGIRAFAVNEFYDSELGKPVSPHSLHGIFLTRCFGGHGQAFDEQVAEQLKSSNSEDIDRPEGKRRRYPIGSAALISVANDRYLAFALCRTDLATCKASSDVTLMWTALNKLWEKARIEAGGDALNVPLVGSGLSGINLPTRDLLNLLILSAITESKAKMITTKIRFILTKDRFDEVDLHEIKLHWER